MLVDKRNSVITNKKKRKYSNYKSTRLYTNFTPKNNGPVPRRIITQLNYNVVKDFVTALGSDSGYQFHMNSIYDPEVALGGHQPYGHDTLELLYGRYRVFKFGWNVKFTSTSLPFHAIAVPVNGTTAPASTLASEMPFSQTEVSSYNGGYQVELKGSIYLPRLNGTSAQEYMTDERFAALFGATPTENLYWSIIVYNPSSTTGLTASGSILLTYWTEVYDPLIQVQS